MAGRKADRAPSANVGANARANSRPSSRQPIHQRFSGFSALMLLVLVIGVIALAQPLHSLIVQRQQIADLQASVDAATAAQTSLEQQLDRWSDPAYIRAQARQRLYFAVAGQQAYAIIDDLNAVPGKPVTTDAADPSKSIVSTDYDWRSLLTQSFVAAATASDPVDQTTGGSGTDSGTDPSSSPAPTQ